MIGSRISHYEILEHLGQGGMGVVYKARDTRLDRTVALKFLPPDLTRDPVAKTRFVHEAKAASALDHANICTVYDIGETDDGQMYIAMAYYEGSSLHDLIENGPISVETALDYAFQAASGLAKAHSGAIVHRDIKPANLMVTLDGQVKIVDFGLAKVAEQTQVTQEGSTLGTAAYMSPEQARGDTVDERTDQWSLGAVIYEMLAGKRAFRGEYSQAIIYSVLNESPPKIRDLNPDVSPELEEVVLKTLSKKPADRYDTVSQLAEELRRLWDLERGIESGGPDLQRIFRRIRSPRVLVPALIGVIAIVAVAVWFSNRQANIRWARNEALPQIAALTESNWREYTDAYTLAVEAERFIPENADLAALFDIISRRIKVETEPPGADVYMKLYKEPEADWEFVGTTPIENLRMPIGIFRWRLEKEGFETVYAAATTWSISPVGDELILPGDFQRVLNEEGTIPDGMVRVPGGLTPGGQPFGDFFIDRAEVTNRQFKEFMDAGGYRNREFWEHAFVRDGETITWEDAMTAFVDQTDRPGPSTWQGSSFPDGQEDFPVSGVSWYEAAAYAVWAGKQLPTVIHWGRARGEQTQLILFPQLGGYATFAPFSNFGTDGPVAVASLPGYSSFGAYDMAGNVREWCLTETRRGKAIRGGAWTDNPYLFTEVSQAPAFDRSERNGFRLAIYPDPDDLPEEVFEPLVMDEAFDFTSLEPVSDEVFEVYKTQFLYDSSDLNVRVESRDDSNPQWTLERISYDAPYGDDRIIGNLFLPKNAAPPYQVVVYFPGSASLFQTSSEHIADYYEFPVFLSFVVKNGRAALYPTYQGTFERSNKGMYPLLLGRTSFAYTEFIIQLVKDFRRSVDFLETREDIDTKHLAYYGMSWGGILGAIIPAVEPRISASILMPGILINRGRPEVHQMNYLKRITVPTLILAGEYDTIQSTESSIRPMLDLLGTAPEDKVLKLYPTDHIPPMNDAIREILAWLDKYLGPVN